MVHQYKNNGYNIVLDVCSGSVHVVDDMVYDIIALYEDHDTEEIIEKLPQYDRADIIEAIEEIKQLVEAEVLFTEDNYKDANISLNPNNVKVWCHICHNKHHKRFCGGGHGFAPHLHGGGYEVQVQVVALLWPYLPGLARPHCGAGQDRLPERPGRRHPGLGPVHSSSEIISSLLSFCCRAPGFLLLPKKAGGFARFRALCSLSTTSIFYAILWEEY